MLSAAFGFECTQVDRGENGRISHAELRFEDGIVMLGSAGGNEFGMKTARELDAVTQGVYLIVDAAIDAHFERAVAAGAEVVRALHDTDYGSQDYAVRDPEGNPLGLRDLPTCGRCASDEFCGRVRSNLKRCPSRRHAC